MSRLDREERAISLNVWESRPYIRWETNDVQPIRVAYTDLGPSRGFMTKIARQWGGYIINRHAPPLGLDKIYAEIRPDEAVFIGPAVRHYHGECPAPDELPERHRHSAALMRHHIARDKFPNDHRGTNSQVVHEHRDPAKYVFPPTPKTDRRWFHAHSRYKKPEKRAGHVERSHGGLDPDDSHSHTSRVKDPERDLAKRIDVHPAALPRFGNAEIVFFVIEGCVKADAVLSAGAAVFSVPSVTLWDATELPAFASRYLVGKVVVIIPDADWIGNGLVMTQARLCQTRLRRLGINACVAAPPTLAGHKGVDDFLAGTGQLAQLEVIDRKFQAGITYFTRKDQLVRNEELLIALAMHADSDGQISVPLRTMARIMGMNPKAVERALHQLAGMLCLTIEGDLAIHRRGWITQNFYSNALEWEERPTITVAEHNRAVDGPPIALNDFLQHIGKKLK